MIHSQFWWKNLMINNEMRYSEKTCVLNVLWISIQVVISLYVCALLSCPKIYLWKYKKLLQSFPQCKRVFRDLNYLNLYYLYSIIPGYLTFASCLFDSPLSELKFIWRIEDIKSRKYSGKFFRANSHYICSQVGLNWLNTIERKAIGY